jgi:hypothetical protein
MAGVSTGSGVSATDGATVKIIAMSGAPLSLTGTLTNTVLATVPIPANALGKNGVLRVTTLWQMTASANNKTLRNNFGGSFDILAGHTVSGAGVQSVLHTRYMMNAGVANSQVGFAAWGDNFENNNTVATGAVDTTVAQNLTIEAQLALISETITLKAYIVELIIPTA